MSIETLLPEGAFEVFDVSILSRLTWLDNASITSFDFAQAMRR